MSSSAILPFFSLMRPSSMGYMAPDTPSEGPQSRSLTKSSYKGLENASDTPSLPDFGKRTYGLNTGPLPDGIDWPKRFVPIIKKHLNMRDVDTKGKTDRLTTRLENWQVCKSKTIDVRPSSSDFGPIAQFKSVAYPDERRFFVSVDYKKHVSAAKKAVDETMCIIEQSVNFGEKRLDVVLLSSQTYHVTIARKTSCDCVAALFNQRSNCKHVIYVLSHMLHAPAELLPQRTLFTDELTKLLASTSKVRPTSTRIDTVLAFKDEVPRSKDRKTCPVCYRDFKEQITVCCNTCGHHVHALCFNVLASKNWGTKCPTCQANWAAAINSEEGYLII